MKKPARTMAQCRALHRIIAADARKANKASGWSRIETIAVCALVVALAVVWAATYVERVL